MPYKTPEDVDWQFTIIEKLKIKAAKMVMGRKLWKFVNGKVKT